MLLLVCLMIPHTPMSNLLLRESPFLLRVCTLTNNVPPSQESLTRHWQEEGKIDTCYTKNPKFESRM